MRILIATSHRNLVGGVETYLQTAISGLADRGHEIGLLHEFPPPTGTELIDAPERSLDSCCFAQAGLDKTMRWALDWRPDVIISNGLRDGVLETTLVDAFPSVLYIHGYYGTCVSERKCQAFPRLQPCSRSLGLACLALYFPRRCGGSSPFTMWRDFRRQSGRRDNFSKYRAILANSTHMREELENHGVDRGRLSVLRLPLPDAASISAPTPRTLPPSDILFVGRLVDVKGGDYLVRALAEAERKLNRKLKLTVAGDGPERGRLEALARSCGLEAEFLGWVDSARRDDLLRRVHLLAVPSLWPEPFGLIGIEGGRFGLPAVGYRVGGIPDWLIPGVSGELADGNPPTVEGLTEAIVRAIQDPGHYSRLCEGAAEVAGQYSFEAHIEQLESILRANSSRA